jgi:hypothetical protein
MDDYQELRMIKTGTNLGANDVLEDDRASLHPDELACVQAAMANGLTDFVVPTPEDNHETKTWSVETYVMLRKGSPVAFSVAYRRDPKAGPHFKVLGPEMDLATKKPKLKNAVQELQKR